MKALMERVEKVIKKAEFLTSISSIKGYKDFLLPEIMIVGRSNVGKSSLINMLSGNGKLAKVSATQGKTKLINFFKFNDEFVLVDLPGYGYSKTGKGQQMDFKPMIEGYINGSKNLKSAVLLVDIRHEPTEQDVQMLKFLAFYNIPLTVVATKCDKVSRAEQFRMKNKIAETFKIGVGNIYPVSSETKQGKSELVQRLYQFVEVKDENLCN